MDLDRNGSNDKWNKVKGSQTALQAVNPIRTIVDNMQIKPNPDKSVLRLSIGDPTVFGNLPFPAQIPDLISEALKDNSCASYQPATGIADARHAIAKKYETPLSPLTANDVVISSGCSHALQMCMAALCERGTTILLPRPCFGVYETIASWLGINQKFYPLDPQNNWEAFIPELEKLIDDKTAAILVNNPSNPCGSVYSKKVADKHGIPLICDEIYAEMQFSGFEFVPMASLTTTVPILTCGGLAKQYLVPGWRVGWILVHDRNDVFLKGEVRTALTRLAQILIGANTLIQTVIPGILNTKDQFYLDTLGALEKNAKSAFECCTLIEGLHPVTPQGAMYMMVGIDVEKFKGFSNDTSFAEQLFAEESVFVLPGSCFKYPNYFRVVLCPPSQVITEAFQRIGEFCARRRINVESDDGNRKRRKK